MDEQPDLSTRLIHDPYRAPAGFEATGDFLNYLARLENSLTPAASALVPEITVIDSLMNEQKGCRLARMSGSGATCFGLFDQDSSAQAAAAAIKKIHPEWWIATGILNRPARY